MNSVLKISKLLWGRLIQAGIVGLVIAVIALPSLISMELKQSNGHAQVKVANAFILEKTCANAVESADSWSNLAQDFRLSVSNEGPSKGVFYEDVGLSGFDALNCLQTLGRAGPFGLLSLSLPAFNIQSFFTSQQSSNRQINNNHRRMLFLEHWSSLC